MLVQGMFVKHACLFHFCLSKARLSATLVTCAGTVARLPITETSCNSTFYHSQTSSCLHHTTVHCTNAYVGSRHAELLWLSEQYIPQRHQIKDMSLDQSMKTAGSDSDFLTAAIQSVVLLTLRPSALQSEMGQP